MADALFAITDGDGWYFLDVDDRGEPMWVGSPRWAMKFQDDELLSGVIERLQHLRYSVKATNEATGWR